MKKIIVGLFVGLGITVSVLMLSQYKIDGKLDYESKPREMNLLVSPTIVQSTSFSEKFEIMDNTSLTMSEIKLTTNLEDSINIKATKVSNNIWEITWVNGSIQFIVNSLESNPFGVDIQPRVTKIDNAFFPSQVYKIDVNSSESFYTSSYYFDSCGNKFCSNGLLSYSDSINLQIMCKSRQINAGQVCDNIIKNLEIEVL